jgi:hypothetical protein
MAAPYIKRKYIISLVFLLLTGFKISAEESKKWLPQIDLNIKYGNKRSLGRIGALGPIAQTSDMLSYVDFRFMADTRENQEGNFGLGQRWLNSKKGYITGVYGYFDRRFSNLGNKYNQLTFGIEYLSVTWDYRGNIYILENKTFTKKTYRSEAATYLNGYQKVENTTNYVQTQKEVPLRGVDFEVGRSVPGLPNLRLYMGYYYYQGRASLTCIKGYQLRSAFNLNDYVSLQAEAKRDNVRKKNYYVGIEFRIPIGKESDKNRSLTTIEKRMTEAPMRDVDIVTNEKETEVVNSQTSTVTSETPKAVKNNMNVPGNFGSSWKKQRKQTEHDCGGSCGSHGATKQQSSDTTSFKRTQEAPSYNPSPHQHSANCHGHNHQPVSTSLHSVTSFNRAAPINQKNAGTTAHRHEKSTHHHAVPQPASVPSPAITPSNHTRVEIEDNTHAADHHNHKNCSHSHSSQPRESTKNIFVLDNIEALNRSADQEVRLNMERINIIDFLYSTHKEIGKSSIHHMNTHSALKHNTANIFMKKFRSHPLQSF